MANHFTSILRLVPGTSMPDFELERLEICYNKGSKTVSLPDQPRPPLLTSPLSFTFDNVFDEDQLQSTVYKRSILDIVDNVLTGYNGTVISLTTLEANDMRTKAFRDPKTGAIRKASRQIFHCLMKSRKNLAQACSNLVVLSSFVIVVNENCHDLLAGFSPSATNSQERPSFPPELEVVDGALKGASQTEVNSIEKMTALLTHATAMEEKVLEVYRAKATGNTTPLYHTVFTISVEYAQFGTMNAPISGSLSFVEVSPSDMLSDRSNLAKLSKETFSLFSFADVVESLVTKPTTFIFPSLDASTGGPNVYKKSILTQLLKEALGGNCKTLLLSYATRQYLAEKHSQTQALLELASQARHIHNNPNRRDLAEKALMTAYMRDLHKRYGEGHSVTTKTDSPTAGTPGDSTDQKERQYKMEMAASALVAAVKKDDAEGEIDSDSWSEEEDEVESHSNREEKLSTSQNKSVIGSDRNPRPSNTKVKIRRKSTRTRIEAEAVESRDSEPTEDIGVDALITILQDPDTGVLRPSVAALKDVKLRTDIGAIFSGAAIVAWMIENVDGVDSEEQAVGLGELLLDKGALIHSEGSMVFANAESLFYYARKGRPSRRTLSQEEIKALLAQARISSTEVEAKTGKGSKMKHPKESIPTIHEVDPELGREEVFEESDPLILSSGLGKKRKKKTTPTVHEIDKDSPQRDECCGEEEEKENSSMNRSRIGSEISDNVFAGSNPTTPLDIGVEVSLTIGNTSPLQSSLSVQPSSQHEGDKLATEDGRGGNDMKETEAPEVESSDPNTAILEYVPKLETLEKAVDYPHPLHEAVAIGRSPGVVRELVMMFGVNQLDDSNRTPLMFAALGNNRRSSCSTLIDCGANVNLQDIYGLTALHVACYHGNKSAANVLLSRGAVLEMLDAKSHSAVHWSIVPESDTCLKLLLRHASSKLVRMADVSGLTALHWAIHFKRPHHLTLLLQKYGDPAHLDTKGRTLVTYALQKGALDCVKVLISTHPSLFTFPDANKSTPLHHASAHPSPKSLLLLLSLTPKTTEEEPLSMNCINSYKRTPLHCAVAYNSLYNADLLLRRGADVQLSDNEGKTPLDYAQELENGEDMLAILEGNASFEWSQSGGTDVQNLLDIANKKDTSSNSKFCMVS